MSERVERVVLVLIVVVVGALAGRASFSHVVQWSIANMPPGTDLSYGYTNAAVSELLPVGIVLFVRYRRRQGGNPGRLAWSMLIAAGLFSLTAQLAVAVPSASGWLVAAVPTLAFIALTKLLLSMKPVRAAEPCEAKPVKIAERPKGTLTALDAHVAPVKPTPREDERAAARLRLAPPVRPKVDAAPATRRVTAKSLTNAAKVTAAVTELGADAKPAQVAVKAGVSESTARRHMAKEAPSTSEELPAETLLADGAGCQLVTAS
jgi:hypothetical protein